MRPGILPLEVAACRLSRLQAPTGPRSSLFPSESLNINNLVRLSESAIQRSNHWCREWQPEMIEKSSLQLKSLNYQTSAFVPTTAGCDPDTAINQDAYETQTVTIFT